MKKTYKKHILRTVRQTFSRFFAIFAIVALGVGFLSGLLATTPDIRYSGDTYFDDSQLYDLRIAGTMGLSEANVQAIRAAEGVEDVMPAYSADVLMQTPGGDTAVTRIHSVPFEKANDPDAAGYLNRVQLLSGRLPQAPGECLVEQSGQFSGQDIKPGDILTLSPDNKDLSETLVNTRYTVVGVSQSSYYCSVEREPASVGNGTLGLILYVSDTDFCLSVYTDVFVRVAEAAAENSLQSAYTDVVSPVQTRLEDIGDAQSALRLAEVKAEAQEPLDDARKEYNDAKAEAEAKLGDAAAELEDAAQKLADGRRQIRENEKKLTDADTQIANGQAELNSGRQAYEAQMAAGRARLNAAQEQITAGYTLYNDGKAQYDAKLAQYDAGAAQLAQGKAFVAQYKTPIEAAHAQLQALLGNPAYTAADLDAYRTGTLAPAAQAAGQSYAAAAAGLADPAQNAYALALLGGDQAAAAAGHAGRAAWESADPAAASAAYAAADGARTALEAAQPGAAAQVEAALAPAQSVFYAAVTGSIQFETLAQTAALLPQLQQTEAAIAANEPALAEAAAQLQAAKEQLDATAQQLNAASRALADGLATLENAGTEARAQFAQAEQQLATARAQYADGMQKLSDAKGTLATGALDFATGEAEYETSKQEATEKLADAQMKIDDAQAELDALEAPDWYVLTRDSNAGFSSFKSNAQKVEAIAKIFPVFFFLVAALVALTTMTRMVEEERLQIGTLKALGYSKGSIIAKYLLYALTASVAGSAFGAVIGMWLFPSVIWNAYTMMYTLPKFYCLFHAPYALGASAAAILCVLLATLNACWATLAECPARLMLPRAPKAGKRILLERIPFLWKRFKFTHKVTARNLFRYKKRFFMTVTGIAGCTALLVTGFGLHDSISDIVNKQFGEIFTYDLTVAVREENALAQGALRGILNDQTIVESWMPVHMEHCTNTYDGRSFETYLFVPEENERLSEFVTLRERLSGKAVPFAEDGVIITEKMSERTGYGIGDTIPIQNNSGATGSFLITGIVENYVQNYVYLSADLYEQEYGVQPAFTLAVARAADSSPEARSTLTARLLDDDDVASVSFTEDLKASFANMMQKIDTIVVVLIISAGALAFVVLYNLTNINIAERSKEIATLKVLGFTDREVSAYVYRESAVLSLIGTLAGLVLGIFLHRFVIYNVEVDAVMFGRIIKPLSYVYAAVLTLVFSRLVDLFMRRKLRKISMVESMKAPE